MRKMYIHKKLFVLGLSATLVTSTFVACSSKSNNANSESSDSVESTEISEDAETSESLYAMVQSIDGDSITAIKGDLNTDVLENQTPPSDDASAPPDMPADNGSSNTSTPPEKPDDNGTGTEGSTPPSDSNAPADIPSGNPGGGTTFVEGTDTITFTVTDDTSITVEFLQGSEDGTIDNITVNSVLELTLDENNKATSIIVKNLQSGGSLTSKNGDLFYVTNTNS